MTTQMPTSLPASPTCFCANALSAPPGTVQATASPPPTAAAEPMKRRRPSLRLVRLLIAASLRLAVAGRGVDRGADARVGAAAADVRHGVVDVGVGRLRVLLEQRRGRHDLARLAVAALRHVVREPRLLHRMALAVARQALDGHDLALELADRHLA